MRRVIELRLAYGKLGVLEVAGVVHIDYAVAKPVSNFDCVFERGRRDGGWIVKAVEVAGYAIYDIDGSRRVLECVVTLLGSLILVYRLAPLIQMHIARYVKSYPIFEEQVF